MGETGFIDEEKLEKAITDFESRYTLNERETLLRILQLRINTNAQKIKTSEVMEQTMKGTGLGKVAGFLTGRG